MKKLSAVLASACAATVLVLSLCLLTLGLNVTSDTAYAANNNAPDTAYTTSADAYVTNGDSTLNSTSENSEALCLTQIDGLSLTANNAAAPELTIASIDGEEATSTEEIICRKVYLAYDAVSESVDFSEDNITYGDLVEALNIVMANPEYYWAGTSFSFGFIDSDGDKQPDATEQVKKLALSYVVDASDVSQVKKSTEAAIEKALSWVDVKNASDFEIAQALHDYLVRNCSYNSEVADKNIALSPTRTAYGALVEGSAVCQGYALAYKLLLARAGIPVIYVTSTDMNHVWNMVQIDGSWYHVDPSWDDPTPDQGFNAEVCHDYFLRSDASFTSLDYYNWQAAYTATSDYANKNYREYKGPYSSEAQSSYLVYWTTCGTCEWSIDNAGCLAIRPANGTSGTLANWGKGLPPWFPQARSILSARIESGVSAATCGSMFYCCSSLTTFDATNLNTDAATDMSFMFAGCSSLAALDLSGVNTSAAVTMNGMFENCAKLRSITLGGKFNFCGAGNERLCSLPTPSGENLTGKWVSSVGGAAYNAQDIPSNVAATYTAEGHVHKLTKVEEVPATCTKEGTHAYWKCEGCNTSFSDANGSGQITTPKSIPALGHNFPASGGTCTRCSATTLLKEVSGAGYYRVTYTPESAIEKGCVTFNGKPMAYDKSANVWTIVVESAPTQSTINAFAVDESATAFALPLFGEERYGDVNNNGKTNIVDAQIAYDLACGYYSFGSEPAYSYLLADVNADNYVDSADALAIQHAIFYGWTKGGSR